MLRFFLQVVYLTAISTCSRGNVTPACPAFLKPPLTGRHWVLDESNNICSMESVPAPQKGHRCSPCLVFSRVAVRSKNGTERNGVRNGTERNGGGLERLRNGTERSSVPAERNGTEFGVLKMYVFLARSGSLAIKIYVFLARSGSSAVKMYVFLARSGSLAIKM